jgi:hypothetical protein
MEKYSELRRFHKKATTLGFIILVVSISIIVAIVNQLSLAYSFAAISIWFLLMIFLQQLFQRYCKNRENKILND